MKGEMNDYRSEKWMRLERNTGEMWEGGKDVEMYEDSR